MMLLLRALVSVENLSDCTTVVVAIAAFTACLGTLAGAGTRQFASGVSLVEVYASVADRAGEPVAGLQASDFTVSEDGVPQRITTFAAGEFPLSVALAIDRSFSMAGDRLATARAAGRAFVDALRPGDQTMIVAIGSETEVAQPLTGDREAVIRAISRLDAWGTTSLYDATPVAIDAVEPARGRRALVLLSDGVDRFSRATAAGVVEHARHRDVIVYPIALGRTGPPIFAELAAATGGRSFVVTDVSRLERTLTAIARELRFQYLLGYTPRHDTAAGWHAIEVHVNRADVRVRARDGYWGR